MKHRKRALQVSMNVTEQSVIALTVNERVQLDRVTSDGVAAVTVRHGKLLEPGTTTLQLPPGQFWFKTLSDASLRVVQGGVTATAAMPLGKDGGGPVKPGVKGDESPGETPMFHVF